MFLLFGKSIFDIQYPPGICGTSGTKRRCFFKVRATNVACATLLIPPCYKRGGVGFNINRFTCSLFDKDKNICPLALFIRVRNFRAVWLRPSLTPARPGREDLRQRGPSFPKSDLPLLNCCKAFFSMPSKSFLSISLYYNFGQS